MAMVGGASTHGSTAGGVVAVARRADEVRDAVIARFRDLLADVRNRLAEMKASRDELRQGRDQGRSGAKRILMDRRESDSGESAG
jgi:hypothetical protein